MIQIGTLRLKIEKEFGQVAPVRTEIPERLRVADQSEQFLVRSLRITQLLSCVKKQFVVTDSRNPHQFGFHVRVHLRDCESALLCFPLNHPRRPGVFGKLPVTLLHIMLTHWSNRIAEALQRTDEKGSLD